jgi:hypothetical protein
MKRTSHPGHDLMPADLVKVLPPLYAAERQADPVAHLKWFTPDSSWTWYVIEYDPEEQLCFGLVIGHERELGYFSLDEILEVRGPFGLPVERDLYFTPAPLSQCQ